MKVKSESEVAQSCPTLSDPMDCSLPGSSVHGICQARVLEWAAIAFSYQGIVGGNMRSAVQCVKSYSYTRGVSSRDLLYNIAPVVNSKVLCSQRFAKRVDLMSSVKLFSPQNKAERHRETFGG